MIERAHAKLITETERLIAENQHAAEQLSLWHRELIKLPDHSRLFMILDALSLTKEGLEQTLRATVRSMLGEKLKILTEKLEHLQRLDPAEFRKEDFYE